MDSNESKTVFSSFAHQIAFEIGSTFERHQERNFRFETNREFRGNHLTLSL